MYQRLLVPIDGSEPARQGLAEAVQLAADQHAQLRLLYVLSDAYLSPPPPHGIGLSDTQPPQRADARAVLDEACTLAQQAGVAAEGVIVESHSYRIGAAIVTEAERWQADLIVMGTHGRDGVMRIILGSDAEDVLRHTPVPVLLLRAQERG